MSASLLLCLSASAGEESPGERFANSPNPVIWADVPDPDVIRVGDDFYMVSTTMHLMPGCPIMHSKDLVNWEIINYVFDTLEDSLRYHLEGGTVYGKGQWATSLRYHDGMFYVMFSPNNAPFQSYIFAAKNPRDKWEQVCRTNHFHDSSLFFDDDGRAYVFYGSGAINLRELKPDMTGVKEGGIDMTVIEPDEEARGLHEGSRAVKYNGKYYIMIINWPEGRNRRQLCYRADNITGPYEKHVVLEDNLDGFPYAAQGTIVDDVDGNWWGFIFQDRGAVGRVPTVMPCRWIDGWPMLGNEDGRIPKTITYTNRGEAPSRIVSSDDFDSDTIGLNWQWNHCPDNEFWSLTDRPGFLRLKTSRIARNIYQAVNTLSQRMEGPECFGSIKMDMSKMKDGDIAGLAAFNGHSVLLSVKKMGRKKYLVKHNELVNFSNPITLEVQVDDEEEERIEIKGNTIYLRIVADFRLGKDLATCFYSLDGKVWNEIGNPFQMRFDYTRLFMGTRFAIFNYATLNSGGYVDIDKFDYKRVEDIETQKLDKTLGYNTHTAIPSSASTRSTCR
ncbi:glycoside hydrolase 43 family protein [uncultured Muribaculum sp.]|nr:glycoside hydrolase 43 family protein [uncultured Muribaculum sp.]